MNSIGVNSGKSESYDCVEENSWVELADVRKLDSLLTQCESISCDNILQHQDVFYHEKCFIPERKYSSTSALYGNVSENFKRCQGSKKSDVFLEDRSFKLIEKKLKKVKKVAKNKDEMASSMKLQAKYWDDKTPATKCDMCSETNINNHQKINNLGCLERSCLCETSLTIPSVSQTTRPSTVSSTPVSNDFTRTPLVQMRQNSRIEQVRQNNRNFQNKDIILVHPREALVTGNNKNNYETENNLRIPSNLSHPRKPASDSKNNQHDNKSVKSETSMRKANNLKFWKFNSDDDGTGDVKESLLGPNKSAEKKMPEQVETVSLKYRHYILLSFH